MAENKHSDATGRDAPVESSASSPGTSPARSPPAGTAGDRRHRRQAQPAKTGAKR